MLNTDIEVVCDAYVFRGIGFHGTARAGLLMTAAFTYEGTVNAGMLPVGAGTLFMPNAAALLRGIWTSEGSLDDATARMTCRCELSRDVVEIAFDGSKRIVDGTVTEQLRVNDESFALTCEFANGRKVRESLESLFVFDAVAHRMQWHDTVRFRVVHTPANAPSTYAGATFTGDFDERGVPLRGVLELGSVVRGAEYALRDLTRMICTWMGPRARRGFRYKKRRFTAITLRNLALFCTPWMQVRDVQHKGIPMREWMIGDALPDRYVRFEEWMPAMIAYGIHQKRTQLGVERVHRLEIDHNLTTLVELIIL